MPPKLVYLTAGAGGMFCGSCLHDNALAKAIAKKGWDVQLVPCYTPIRTDESDFSVDQVFFGGINVFLQQKIPLFRYLPKWIDAVFDNPRLLKRVTTKAVETDPTVLGNLALSMLKGIAGNQRKEVRRLVQWLSQEAKPDVLVISNVLIAGFVKELKRVSPIPVVVTLQGDDVFLNSLPDDFRDKCLKQIQNNNQWIDGFLVHSEAFRTYMAEYFRIPLSNIAVTPLGIDTGDYVRLPPASLSLPRANRAIGYFARLAPEKGLQELVGAFIALRNKPEFSDVQLRIAGWLSPEKRSFAAEQWTRLQDAGLENSYQYLGVLDRAKKIEFLQSLDVFSVPVTHPEPKGLFALEAMACGIPVVLPRRGALTELINQSGGGLLYDAETPGELEANLAHLLRSPEKRATLGSQGRSFVLEERNESRMATDTLTILQQFLPSAS